MTADVELLPCAECGMPCRAGEYHPFAACLMFKACHNSETVRANLAPLQAENERLRAEVDALRREVGELYMSAKRRDQYVAEKAAQAADAIARADKLTEALREAREMVEDWAGYAGEYFQNKHDLQGDLAKLDAALREQEEGHEQ